MTHEDYDELEQDRFEARLFGTMPDADAVAFDAELRQDPEMRERFRVFTLAIEGIQAGEVRVFEQERNALRERMHAIDVELDRATTAPRYFMRPWMGWAAAAMVILGVGLAWVQGRQRPERLAQEFAIPEPGIPVLMGVGAERLDPIMNAYKANDWDRAAILLEQARHQAPSNDTLQYFTGIVAERQGDHARAAAHFARVSDGAFVEKAAYHQALCWLQLGDVEQARRLLAALDTARDAHIAERARALLRRM